MQLAVSRCRIGAFVRQLAEDIRSDAVGSIAVINGRFEGNAVRISRYLPSDHNSARCRQRRVVLAFLHTRGSSKVTSKTTDSLAHAYKPHRPPPDTRHAPDARRRRDRWS